MYNNILVPFDDSTHAEQAYASALEIAEMAKPAKVTVLKIVPRLDVEDASYDAAALLAGVTPPKGKNLEKLKEEHLAINKDTVEKHLSQIAPSLPEGVEVDVVVKSGRPQDEIIKYAKEDKNEVDLIVMGRRGLGAIRSAIGSVSFAVLHSTDKPVLLTK